MVREIKNKGTIGKLRDLTSSRFFIPVAIIVIVLITIPVIRILSSGILDFRQRAAPGTPTATMNITPSNGSYTVGQLFTISLVIDGGGQDFNAAQADIAISSNLEVQSLTLTPNEVGGCGFAFVNQVKTPTITDPSFAGAILQTSKANCTLFTMTLLAKSVGTGSIALSKVSVKSFSGHRDILLSSQNGNYILAFEVTPTSIPTTPPTPTPTSVPPTLTPTSVPPTPTPTGILLNQPTIDSHPSLTYESSIALSGTKTPDIYQIFINNSSSGVSYPSSTRWVYTANLVLGENVFDIYGKNDFGDRSQSISTNISRHELSDISGDNVVDITDLSIFGTDWEKTESLNSPLSDMDIDGKVDLTDFSILAANYGE